MFTMPVFDVAGPETFIAVAGLGLIGLVIMTAVIVGLEAAILIVLKWGTPGRSLLAALVMNEVTTLVGFLVLLSPVGLFLDFVLSVLIEGVILMLFNRGALRKNWIAALAANGGSYLFVILPVYLLVFVFLT